MYSALDPPEKDNEPERRYIAFSATEVTPMAATTPIEKDTWPLGSFICRVPCSWLFVERSKRTISLGEQDKSQVNHIHERGNEDDVPIYGTYSVGNAQS